MTRADVLSTLKAMEPELKKLGFGKLYLFGSVGRDEPDPKDVDLLFEPTQTKNPGFFDICEAQERIEEKLGRPIDLVDRERIHRRIRQQVEAEKIEIY